MQPAAWRRFQCDPNCQKKKYDFHENGERAGNLLPNRERWRYRGTALTRIKGDEIPLQGDDIRDRARSVCIYIR